MSAPPPDSVRIGGMAGLAAGIVGAAIAITVEFVEPVVPPTETSYPLSSTAFVWVELLLTLVHIGILAAVVALSVSRVAGRSRAARIGLALALIGFTIHVLPEFGFVFAATTDTTAPLPGALGAIFGVSTLIAAVGMILAGLGVVREGVWEGWRRYAPLAMGIGTALILLLSLVDGARNWTLALWCLLSALLGLGLATRPTVVQASRSSIPQR
jgi:hypothetical protein